MAHILLKFTMLLFLLAGLTNCSSDTEYVRSHEWKYGSGFHMGDWLGFDNTTLYEVRHDTIFMEGFARAVVVEIARQAGEDVELRIRSLETGEEGVYHEK